MKMNKNENIYTKNKTLNAFILFFLVLLIITTIFSDSFDTYIVYLSEKDHTWFMYNKKSTFASICQMDFYGNGALLGRIIHNNYDKKTIFTMPFDEKIKRNGPGIYQVLFYMRVLTDVFASPRLVEYKKYNWSISESEFEYLKAISKFSEKGYTLSYYLTPVKNKDTKLGLFIYKYYAFIAPLNWRSKKA